ncbi:Cupin domain protein [Pirellulimonas nuda]|uniref:Cupin domain protein n=1 Tax=Pirellulimonas nuda TaxID=2528009 RepID=A0A518DEE1_9BACT|nr:cupin domain-containing protein [Pirellulimonas nuda]QDU89802.1 Cupin domain protein [Pirellulimonas nuda]
MTDINDAGRLIDLFDTGAQPEPKPKLLLQNDAFKVMRLALPAGKTIAEHKAPKEIVVQCVTGRVEFTAMGQTHTMAPGNLLHLPPSEPHALTATADSIVLVTMAK